MTLIRRSPPRTRRSSASSVGSCAGGAQTQLHAARSVSSNRSRSPTPHQPSSGKQQTNDEPRKINRSRSPTPQRKFLASPSHQTVDFGKQRSRSPTPKAQQFRSNSPATKGCTVLDSPGRSLNEDARSPTHHGRHQEVKVG